MNLEDKVKHAMYYWFHTPKGRKELVERICRTNYFFKDLHKKKK